ncbi:hypothetical protein KJN74_03960 [Candidatus Bathyarchaeota archaeon]|nr:hypothetical protein [Candidatus Bathyarchaeota archaeon]
MNGSGIKKWYFLILILITVLICAIITNSLLNRIANLETTNENLELQLEKVKQPFLFDINNKYTDHYWEDPPYIRCEVTAFNAGHETASNVTLTINLWDPVGWLITSKTFQLGSIQGRNYENFDVNIEYFRKVDNITIVFEYD